MLIFELHFQAGSGSYLQDGKLSDTQATSIKVTLDLFQLLMTWALAIIGATGFFLKLNIEKGCACGRSTSFCLWQSSWRRSSRFILVTWALIARRSYFHFSSTR